MRCDALRCARPGRPRACACVRSESDARPARACPARASGSAPNRSGGYGCVRVPEQEQEQERRCQTRPPRPCKYPRGFPWRAVLRAREILRRQARGRCHRSVDRLQTLHATGMRCVGRSGYVVVLRSDLTAPDRTRHASVLVPKILLFWGKGFAAAKPGLKRVGTLKRDDGRDFFFPNSESSAAGAPAVTFVMPVEIFVLQSVEQYAWAQPVHRSAPGQKWGGATTTV